MFTAKLASTTLKTVLLGGALITLTACFQTPAPPMPQEAIEYRQSRFDEMTILRAFETCSEEALKLDQQARRNKSPGQYMAAAKQLQNCESDLGASASQADLQSRMRNYALSIQNLLKAGDIPQAQQALTEFQSAFVGHDLYYPDGSSFIENMEALLGQKDDAAFGRFALLNISKEVKQEMRRKNHWATH